MRYSSSNMLNLGIFYHIRPKRYQLVLCSFLIILDIYNYFLLSLFLGFVGYYIWAHGVLY